MPTLLATQGGVGIRPNLLATHCHQNYDLSKDLEVYIVDYAIHDLHQSKRMENKVIYKLQTMGQHGLNEQIGAYAKEMCATWTTMLLGCHTNNLTSSLPKTSSDVN